MLFDGRPSSDRENHVSCRVAAYWWNSIFSAWQAYGKGVDLLTYRVNIKTSLVIIKKKKKKKKINLFIFLQKMSKTIPKINISVVENDYDESEINEAVTDCESIETCYTPRKLSFQNIDDMLTDVELSSNDEEDIPNYPLHLISPMLDIATNFEEAVISQGPNKSQRSVTCSLEKFSRKNIYENDNTTDIEAFPMSEDDEPELTLTEFLSYTAPEHNEVIKISDLVLKSQPPSPARTPDPRRTSPCIRTNRSPKHKSKLTVSGQRAPLTDVELLSDNEIGSTRVKKFKNKAFKAMLIGLGTDSDDSEASVNTQSSHSRRHKRVTGSFDGKQKSKNTLKVNLPKKEVLTDTEIIEVNEKSKKENQLRPTVIQKHKSVNQPKSVIKQVGKCEKKEPNYYQVYEKPGHATDIETFESEDEVYEDVKPVAYIPGSKYELVLSNESLHGKVSFIMPIKESKFNSLRADLFDCGISDVEDLPDYEEEIVRYPTPDLPRNENSVIRNSENYVDKAKLRILFDSYEPVTDTEDLKFDKPVQGKKNFQDNATDIEDSDREETVIHASSTDFDEFSDDFEEDQYKFRAITPEISNSNTFVMLKESHRPFSDETKRKMRDDIPKIRKISPSPVPCYTDIEDLVASQEDCDQYMSSDGEKIENYKSVIHIKHTRKFQTDGPEQDHIKGCYFINDPLTDIEEIGLSDSDTRGKQKIPRQDSSVRTCFSAMTSKRDLHKAVKPRSKYENKLSDGKEKLISSQKTKSDEQDEAFGYQPGISKKGQTKK